MIAIKDTKLIINSGLKIQTGNDRSVTISSGTEKFKFDFRIFSILDQFSKPNSIANALNELIPKTSGRQEWIELTDTLIGLYKNTILIEADAQKIRLKTKPGSYNSASFHIALLNDRVRTKSFIDAIKKTVKKGDIVLDIGTGTGVLAIAAAKSGAGHVYAIESSGFAEMAEMNFEINGLKDKITLIKDTSTRMNLPMKADLLVSEIIGNEPLGENILEVFSDAIKRHLSKNPRVIPQRLRVYALPVNIPNDIIKKHFFVRKHIKDWKSWYGIDFRVLKQKEKPEVYDFYINPHKARKWPALGKPVLLTDISLNSIRSFSIKVSRKFKFNKPGLLNGILIYFESRLCPGINITTNPNKAEKSNSWSSKVWLLPTPVKVSKNQQVTINYNYRVPSIGNKISINF